MQKHSLSLNKKSWMQEWECFLKKNQRKLMPKEGINLNEECCAEIIYWYTTRSLFYYRKLSGKQQ